MKSLGSKVLSFLRRRWWLVLIVVVIVAGGAYWWYQQQNTQQEIHTEQPQYRDLVETIDFTGFIDARERVAMNFAGAGKLVYLGAKEGDSVQRGQTIASLDQRTLQKQLESRLSEYQTQRWSFENAEDARNDQVVDTQEERRLADIDQFSLDRSVLNVEIQSLAFDSYRLSAPFSGILVQSPYTVTGVFVSPTDVWELVNPDTLYFRVLVDEIDVDSIHVGQEALVEIDAFAGKTLRAEVEKIAYQVSHTANGSVFPVELRFLDQVNIEEQRVGMNGEARLILAQRSNALSIPVEAVMYRDDQNMVEVLVNGKPEQRTVEIGIETDDYAEILSGLSENDQVILP